MCGEETIWNNKYDVETILSNIYEEWNKIFNENRREAKFFNFFDILGISRKEVLMCRMLQAILSPQGEHGKSTYFLKSFVSEVLKMDDFAANDKELQKAVVKTEYLIPSGRRIDITIETPNRFIPIEVKIEARDQKNQCIDYWDCAKQKNEKKKSEWALYYLTLFGTEPSEESISSDYVNKNFEIRSWKNDVSGWLAKIIEENEKGKKEAENKEEKKDYKRESVGLPQNVIEIIIQYYKTILDITNQSSKEESKIVQNIITKNSKNMKAADLIYNNYNGARVKILMEFYDQMKKKFEEVTNKSINIFNIENQFKDYYNNGNSTHPGISYKVREFEVDNEKYTLYLRFEIDFCPFIGFCVRKSTDRKSDKYYLEDASKVSEQAKKFLLGHDLKAENEWLIWEYISKNNDDTNDDDIVNFKIQNTAYYNIFDEKWRNEYISNGKALIEKYYKMIK